MSMLSFPGRALLALYSGFLLFYFVPWNLRNIQKADQRQTEILQNYGAVSRDDDFEIVLTQLFALFYIVVSLISIYKCAVVVTAPESQTQGIYLYPLTIMSSIALSLLANDKHNSIILMGAHSIFLFAHPLLAIVRGVVFYKIYFTTHPKKIQPAKKVAGVVDEPIAAVAAAAVETGLTFSGVVYLAAEMLQKTWFLCYWAAYALAASVFYNEVCKYLLEEHVSVEGFMQFVFV